jgi:hypothetical protein
MRYRKKPVVIEAYQTDKELDIETLEGTMHASVGDYIITGVRGEQYPCKSDIFEQTYEPADVPTASPWRRVEEELPKYGQDVLAARLYGSDADGWAYEIVIAHVCEVRGTNYWNATNITHWMPLPEPPKEDA